MVKGWIKTLNYQADERGARRNEAGMTLVELLVVLAIIAIVASASVLSFGVGAGMSAQAEARRLEARMQLAADESMLDDRAIGLSIGPAGYTFVERDDSTDPWRRLRSGALSDDHHMATGVTVVSGDGRSIVPLGLAGSIEDISVRVAGKQAWIVSFDGLTARARPAGSR